MLCVSFLIIRVALQVENFKTDDSKQAVGKWNNSIMAFLLLNQLV